MVRCLVLILALVLGDAARLICYGLVAEGVVCVEPAADEEQGCCGSCEQRSCETELPPRPTQRECCCGCPLDQGAVIPQKKVVGEPASEPLAPVWDRAWIAGARLVAPTRSGMPEMTSRMRRAVLCIRMI